MPPQSLPTVTIVVVNYNGREYLEPCLGSLFTQHYPQEQVEVILVDNASTDGSVELVRDRFPQVQVITNETNTGFAPAVNQGAHAGTGDVLALVNNDAVADPEWLRELVKPLVMHEQVVCTGGLVLDERGESVDFAGGEAAFYGHGFAAHRGQPPPGDLRQGPTLFATGASLATKRAIFLDVGGFDPDYFAFFEDLDYGWRLWVLGHEVWFVPTSVLYHYQHGTIERFGYPRERYLLERNALATIFKNYGDDLLARTLPTSVILSLLRGLSDSDPGDYRIKSEGADEPQPHVSPLTGAHLAALRDFGLLLEPLRAKRVFVQSRRLRDDAAILRLFRRPHTPNASDATFLGVFEACVDTFNLVWPSPRQRVLVITADTVGPKMAGPAIRAWEMAKTLSKAYEVILAASAKPEITHDRFRVVHLSSQRLESLLEWAEVVVVQGFTLFHYPEIAESDLPVVVDIYDPFHIEALVLRRNEEPAARWALAKTDREVVNEQLRRGDLFLCASDKQRDFWLGQLAAVGRINPATLDQGPDLRGLLDIAPFGLPEKPPVQERHAIKGAVEGIGEDDFVLLWGGGIYNWFDPVTLIRAVAKASADEPRLKLFFLGTAHPNPDVPEMARASEAYRVAAELGLLDRHVFFNPGWVDYEDRHNYLLDADVGVSTHFLHIETELSFRTRILDYLWAGLPILCTEGDSLSRLVRGYDLGEVVQAEDVDDLAAGILRIADPDRHAAAERNVEALAPTMTWDRALAPLAEFCRFPRRAPDFRAGTPYVNPAPYRPPRRSPAWLAKRFVEVSREKGLSNAIRMARHSIRLRREVAAVRAQTRGGAR